MTTVPLARVSSIARLMTAFDFVAAVISVRSAPWPAGEVADERLHRVGVARAGVEAERERPLDALGVEIEADHTAAGGPEQLRR